MGALPPTPPRGSVKSPDIACLTLSGLGENMEWIDGLNVYASTYWQDGDIKARKPKWSYKKRQKWLKEHESAILDAMITAGNELIDDLLR